MLPAWVSSHGDLRRFSETPSKRGLSLWGLIGIPHLKMHARRSFEETTPNHPPFRNLVRSTAWIILFHQLEFTSGWSWSHFIQKLSVDMFLSRIYSSPTFLAGNPTIIHDWNGSLDMNIRPKIVEKTHMFRTKKPLASLKSYENMQQLVPNGLLIIIRFIPYFLAWRCLNSAW